MSEEVTQPSDLEPATLKPSYQPKRWRHHRRDEKGRPIPPGPTYVYKGPTTEGKVLVHTEEEYNDHLNRGYKDTPAPEAWQ